MSASSDHQLTICGAGLAGSLLAVFLGRRGHRVRVLESRPDLRRAQISAGRSINLALAERGIQALEAAGVMPRVRELTVPMPGRMLHDPRGELTFQRYGRRPEEVNYSVTRGGLNAVLMDAAEATGRVEFEFQTACSGLDLDRGALTLVDQRDGQTRVESAAGPVFGADGAGSPVRASLAQQRGVRVSEELLPHAYKELSIPPGEGGAHRIQREALHIWPRGGHMLIALPNLDGSFTVTLFLPSEGEPGFSSLTDQQRLLGFFEQQFPDALEQLPDLASDFFANPTGMLGTVRCDRWHDAGRVVLLGDAAHAVVPFHGQGMNCAFEDCLALDRLVERHGDRWPTIFEAYEQQRKDNADAIADMALENYVEMRDTVRDPRFQLRKELGFLLEERHPERFIPRYSMVMFHAEIPYAEARRRGALQLQILQRLTRDVDAVEQVDLALADRLIQQQL